MEKVLVISYHFPPSGGSKTRRLLKFLKFLPQYRWRPVVLTTTTGTGFGFDPSLLKSVPQEVRVHRAFDLSSFLKRVLPGFDRRAPTNAKPARQSGNTLKGLGSRWCRLALAWIKRWIAIPDVFVLVWAPFALCRGLSAVGREQAAVIYSTGPPFSNHIVGMCLKRLTGKPLILDFRDAWSANPVRRMKHPAGRRPIEVMLERIVVRSADLVVSTTEGMTTDFRRRYASESDEKFMTLPNGYDRDEFSPSGDNERDRSPKMRIVHTGHLRGERSPKPLLSALRNLLDEQSGLTDDLEVYLVGESKPFLDGKTISHYLAELRLESVVKLVGHVPQPEAIRYQMGADILLLIIGVVPPEEVATYGIASKVFDYMLAGKPVLTLADTGPVSELVERTQIGPVFPTSDIEGIKLYLADAVKAFKDGRLEVKSNKDEIERYDFQKLTGQLAEKFDSLCADYSESTAEVPITQRKEF